MSALFNTEKMAAGYAHCRPPVHPHVVDLISKRLGLSKRVHRVLDVGCGAGLSTAPLERLAEQSIGIEPAEAMLRWHSETAPGASFLTGMAEDLPIRSQSIDIIAAAGSLNYADLDRFFPEAVRVLNPKGTLVIYDFSAGRGFRESEALGAWYREFEQRYPWPACREISPESLDVARFGLRVSAYEHFNIGLTLAPEFYLDYVMTETNVADAIRRGAREESIRDWCATTLDPVFQGVAREVLFTGYIAYAVHT